MDKKHKDACEPAAGLRRAMEHVLALQPERVVLVGADGISGRVNLMPMPVMLPARVMYPGGFMSHAVPEMMMPVEGAGLLLTEQYAVPLERGEVAVVMPGVRHCEADRCVGRYYSAMWLIPARDAVLAHFSERRERRGWGVRYHGCMKGSAAATISDILGEAGSLRGRHQDAQFWRLKAAILAGLALLHEMEVGRLLACSLPERSGCDRGVESMIEMIKTHIESHIADSLSLKDLGSLAGLSPRYLNRLFREHTGETIHCHVARMRMERALALCRDGRLMVKEIAAATGYRDPLYFSRAFKRHTGASVTHMRKVLHVKRP